MNRHIFIGATLLVSLWVNVSAMEQAIIKQPINVFLQFAPVEGQAVGDIEKYSSEELTPFHLFDELWDSSSEEEDISSWDNPILVNGTTKEQFDTLRAFVNTGELPLSDNPDLERVKKRCRLLSNASYFLLEEGTMNKLFHKCASEMIFSDKVFFQHSKNKRFVENSQYEKIVGFLYSKIKDKLVLAAGHILPPHITKRSCFDACKNSAAQEGVLRFDHHSLSRTAAYNGDTICITDCESEEKIVRTLPKQNISSCLFHPYDRHSLITISSPAKGRTSRKRGVTITQWSQERSHHKTLLQTPKDISLYSLKYSPHQKICRLIALGKDQTLNRTSLYVWDNPTQEESHLRIGTEQLFPDSETPKDILGFTYHPTDPDTILICYQDAKEAEKSCSAVVYNLRSQKATSPCKLQVPDRVCSKIALNHDGSLLCCISNKIPHYPGSIHYYRSAYILDAQTGSIVHSQHIPKTVKNVDAHPFFNMFVIGTDYESIIFDDQKKKYPAIEFEGPAHWTMIKGTIHLTNSEGRSCPIAFPTNGMNIKQLAILGVALNGPTKGIKRLPAESRKAANRLWRSKDE